MRDPLHWLRTERNSQREKWVARGCSASADCDVQRLPQIVSDVDRALAVSPIREKLARHALNRTNYTRKIRENSRLKEIPTIWIIARETEKGSFNGLWRVTVCVRVEEHFHARRSPHLFRIHASFVVSSQ